MEKYEYLQLLNRNIQKQMNLWLNKEDKIRNSDLYSFLYSIVNSALTIGFEKGERITERLISQLKESNKTEWNHKELQFFLFPLYSAFDDGGATKKGTEEEISIRERTKKLILVIDDDRVYAQFLKEQLEKEPSFIVKTMNLNCVISSYDNIEPDCFIIDIHMKQQNGFDILQIIKEKVEYKCVPIIIISNDYSKKTRLLSYKLGADDFIEKPLEMDEFIIRINRQLDRKEIIDELIMTDELTGVYNRRFLKKSYDRLIRNLKRKKEYFSMAIIDIDNFKNINDLFGHLEGDTVLENLSTVMKSYVRDNDIIIRYGGEEFILLFPNTKLQDAKIMIEKILEQYSQIKFGHCHNEFTCTFSAGVLEVSDIEMDLNTNLSKMDDALYYAKNNGKNQVKDVQRGSHLTGKKLNIGIINDNTVMRKMFVSLMKNMYYKKFDLDIQAFKNDAQFLEAGWHLREEPYLIILNEIKPQMEKLEVVQEIKKSADIDNFTIVKLTARNDEENTTKVLPLDVDNNIIKPFKQLELKYRLDQLLRFSESDQLILVI
ncbi:diguanylate cyclase [Metabacillus fastidiosus]|uniref:diguanylate cyclase n=1 Tax=Metabacillus fastidiosus TaxID=1458 RepID=UPI002DB7B3C1|nr:diguanylate cyclase [Metabacillus fastidiosus]MEC2076170.1 diguanylate cyclase [Metabacillus fastidiosus]